MNQPLKGIKVLEFTHVVMGPALGLILADLGAEVIHVEPIHGDSTRKFSGFGAGFFSFYNRNKRSLAIDLKTPKGKEIIYQLCEETDILVENFSFGTFDKLGFSYEKIKSINPRIIYCSLKGFLNGPYEQRNGMDEIAQMMGGLAYMTGKKGEPTRAGTSVSDITGGMFGAIGILTALYEREKTNEGQYIKSGLFETCVFMMGQFMACINAETKSVSPMPNRELVWPIYQLFKTVDNSQIFIGIVSDKQWIAFCEAFKWKDLLHDKRFSTDGSRRQYKIELINLISSKLAKLSEQEIAKVCLANDVPHGAVGKPEDLFHNPHLVQGNHLFETYLSDGHPTFLPKLPFRYGLQQHNTCTPPPQIGEHSVEILEAMGFSKSSIENLKSQMIIA